MNATTHENVKHGPLLCTVSRCSACLCACQTTWRDVFFKTHGRQRTHETIVCVHHIRRLTVCTCMFPHAKAWNSQKKVIKNHTHTHGLHILFSCDVQTYFGAGYRISSFCDAHACRPRAQISGLWREPFAGGTPCASLNFFSHKKGKRCQKTWKRRSPWEEAAGEETKVHRACGAGIKLLLYTLY
jgi:hypothetical protein